MYTKIFRVGVVTRPFLQYLEEGAVQFHIVAAPMVRGHGYGPISTDNSVVMEQTKNMMKLEKVENACYHHELYSG